MQGGPYFVPCITNCICCRPPEPAPEKGERISLAEAAIIAGVKDVLHQVLSRRNLKEDHRSKGGRLKHDDRVVHSVLSTAVAFKAGKCHAFAMPCDFVMT